MSRRFHDVPFDDATQLKLELFRRYIRNWIPVFLTRQKDGRPNRSVHIFDFFAGPGRDTKGTPGSPLIVTEELRAFCEANAALRTETPSVTLHFSDSDSQHVEALSENLRDAVCSRGCCRPSVSNAAFAEALESAWPILRNPLEACLVIMDQFGLKEVTPAVLNGLAACPVTDVLFFISSSFIRRFAGEPSIQQYFKVTPEELQNSEYRLIHRFICEYFRSQLPPQTTYHLAPFSIKKGANIYGVVFGSGSYLGLHKFLQACWELDGVTGEANYPVDGDLAWKQKTLFDEFNVIKKQDMFKQEIAEYIQSHVGNCPSGDATNGDLFELTCRLGFLPTHTTAELKALQSAGQIDVVETSTGKPARKGAFYVSWNEYRDRDTKHRVAFRIREDAQ